MYELLINAVMFDFTQSSVHKIRDNAERITENVRSGTNVFVGVVELT